MIVDPTSAPSFTEFDPRAYLATYFATVMQDEAQLLDWLVARGRLHLGEHGTSLRLCDLGSGPTVHRAFPVCDLIAELEVRDLLEGNLEEIDRWRHGATGSHDWAPFARHVAQIAPHAAAAEVLERVRRVLRVGHAIDLFEPEPGGELWDAVTLYFVACSACTSDGDFARLIDGAVSFLRPGGCFLAAYLGGCSAYRVGDRWFPSPRVTEHTIRNAYAGAKMTITELTRLDTPDMADDGFDHIFAVAATRTRTQPRR